MDADAFIVTPRDVGLPQIVEIGDNIVREANAVENLVPKDLVIIPSLPTLLRPLNSQIMPTKNFTFEFKNLSEEWLMPAEKVAICRIINGDYKDVVGDIGSSIRNVCRVYSIPNTSVRRWFKKFKDGNWLVWIDGLVLKIELILGKLKKQKPPPKHKWYL